MGKKAKERKQTQVSPDYISASAGNSGILRDMAGHFAGTGRYVVPTITAACAMQGTVMPVCQVQAADVTPADSVTIGFGDSMTVPEAGTFTVNGVNINSGGMMSVSSGGVADTTTVSSGGSMTIINGTATNTYIGGGAVNVSSGGKVSYTTVDDGGAAASSGVYNLTQHLVVFSGGTADNTILNYAGLMEVSGGSVTNTSVSTAASIKVRSDGMATSTTLNNGGMTVHEGGRATGIYAKDGTVLVYGYAQDVTISDGSFAEAGKNSIINDAVINSGCTMLVRMSGTVNRVIINSGGDLYTGRVDARINDAVVNGGSMRLQGGRAQASSTTVINNGLLRVAGDSVASDTIVDLDGTMTVVGGSASKTAVNSGTLVVTSGMVSGASVEGSVDATTVNSGGSMTVMDGTGTGTIVNGGSLTVSSGGTVSNTVVDLDGTMMVVGGSAVNTTVNSGTLAVTSGGSVDTTHVSSGGSMTVMDGTGTSTTVNGGSLTVSSGGMANDTVIDLDGTMMVVGGSASNTEINSGSMIVSSGGVASVTKVNSGGSMTVSSGGMASSTTISGGSVTINAGSATDTNISSGNMNVLSGGMASDTTAHSGGVLSVTGSSTVNNVVLSGGVFTNPVAGTTALISGTVTGDGDITGPGDFTIANGNILLNSGEVSTTGKLTIDKVLDTTKPAVSATTLDVGSVDVTDMNVGFSNSGTLIETATPLTSLTLVSATSQTDLSNVNSSVTIDGGMRINKSIPGVTVEYSTPPVTYSLVNNAQQIDYSINGNKQATRLTFGSIGWLDTGTLIDHTNQFDDVIFSGATVDTSAIHFNNVASMEANKTMTLVSDFGTSVGKIIGTKYTVGTTLQGNGKAELVGNDLVYKVETASNEVQEQTHNTLMGMEAGLATINSGQEFIEKAVDGFGDINNTGNDGIAVYAGMGVGKDRYETGSHININTWNGIVGVGKSHQLENGRFQWGGFVEHGSGKFTTYNAGQRGDGSTDYTGGGVAAKWTNKHDVYTEVGLRYGRAHDSASNMLRDALGNSYGYNVHADYYGGYFGLGKIYRFGADRSLDVYGKFYSTHRDGVSFDAGGHYDLDSLQSNILRVGAKYRAKAGKVNWYGGLAYEHEFGGEATGRADAVPIRAASIKGGSLRADLGISLKASEDSPWTMDLGITGHTGKHRGIGGRIFIGCKF